MSRTGGRKTLGAGGGGGGALRRVKRRPTSSVSAAMRASSISAADCDDLSSGMPMVSSVKTSVAQRSDAQMGRGVRSASTRFSSSSSTMSLAAAARSRSILSRMEVSARMYSSMRCRYSVASSLADSTSEIMLSRIMAIWSVTSTWP